MINPRELRLNNLIEYMGGIYSVDKISEHFIGAKNIKGFASGDFPIDKINPVPITEERLIKAGFRKTGIYCFFLDGIDMKEGGGGAIEIIQDGIVWDILIYQNFTMPEERYTDSFQLPSAYYFHSLQNIVLDLAGREI